MSQLYKIMLPMLLEFSTFWGQVQFLFTYFFRSLRFEIPESVM